MTATNHRILLNARPHGLPQLGDFRLEEAAVPQPADGQVLLRTLYLSLDPYMRRRMDDAPSYAPPLALGELMVGATVNRVEASRHPAFKAGDVVTGSSGWQQYSLSDGSDIALLDNRIPHPSLALGVLGFPGFTAYHGLLNIGQPKPGETVVVASATGAVGATVGQIAKIKGARAIGIAGGPEKCRYAVDELGFDVCLDHRASDLAQQLAVAAPDGIDVYFENVGGTVFEAVLPLLNVGARIPLCGLIAHYNDAEPPAGPDRFPQVMWSFLSKRVRLEGFIISDHVGSGFDAFTRDVGDWVDQGRIKLQEVVIDGIERAPQAFIDHLSGKHFGKVIVRVSDDA